jgi:hypothetical protein
MNLLSVFELLNDAEDVVFAKDQVLCTVDLHFRAGVLAEEDLVADFDIRLAERAVIQDLAVSDCDHCTFHGFFFCVVRDDDPTNRLFFAFQALHKDAILQGSDFHEFFLHS